MSGLPLVWFYRPSWWWTGWLPFAVGSDEWFRTTVVLGWGVTGRVVIPVQRAPRCHCGVLAEWMDFYDAPETGLPWCMPCKYAAHETCECSVAYRGQS